MAKAKRTPRARKPPPRILGKKPPIGPLSIPSQVASGGSSSFFIDPARIEVIRELPPATWAYRAAADDVEALRADVLTSGAASYSAEAVARMLDALAARIRARGNP